MKKLMMDHNIDCEMLSNEVMILLDASKPKPDDDILPELLEREILPDPNHCMKAREGAFRRGFQDPMACSFWPAKFALALARKSSEHVTFLANCKVLSIEKETDNKDGRKRSVSSEYII